MSDPQDTDPVSDPVTPGDDPENNDVTPAPEPTDPGNDGKTAEELQKDLDKANMELNMHRNKSKDGDDTNQATNEYVAELAKKETIGDFLKEKVKDFPDVTLDDLMVVDDPEQLESYAGTMQRRIDDAVQKKLESSQKAGAPTQTPDERAAKLKKAKAKGDFGSYLNAKLTPTK